MRHTKRLMNLKKNRKGGIEGLPLQLMIVILVATMGTAILMGWMGNISEPNSIGTVDVVSGDIILEGNRTETGHAEIFVTDQKGNPLFGATVILTGLGVLGSDGKTAHGTTDASGHVVFDNLRITLRGSTHGFITVSVSMSDYGENNSTRIAVIG